MFYLLQDYSIVHAVNKHEHQVNRQALLEKIEYHITITVVAIFAPQINLPYLLTQIYIISELTFL